MQLGLLLKRLLIPGLYFQYSRIHEAALTLAYCMVFWCVNQSFTSNVLYIIYTHYLMSIIIDAHSNEEIDIFHNIFISHYLSRDFINFLAIILISVNYLMLSILLFGPRILLTFLGMYLMVRIKDRILECIGITYIEFTNIGCIVIGIFILAVSMFFETQRMIPVITFIYLFFEMWIVYGIHYALLLIDVNIPLISILNSVVYIAAAYTFLIINIGILRGNLI